MRIISGQAKGRALKVPRGVSRPTTDRVRESVFGVLAPVIAGAKVLDLFAGSGSLGLEALSRGANQCVFVERDRGACRVIEENLKKTALAGGQIRPMEVSRFLQGRGSGFDLVFADPPYADGLSDPSSELMKVDDWSDWLADEGYLILEQEASSDLMDLGGLEVLQSREYGRSRITFYRKEAGA